MSDHASKNDWFVPTKFDYKPTVLKAPSSISKLTANDEDSTPDALKKSEPDTVPSESADPDAQQVAPAVEVETPEPSTLQTALPSDSDQANPPEEFESPAPAWHADSTATVTQEPLQNQSAYPAQNENIHTGCEPGNSADLANPQTPPVYNPPPVQHSAPAQPPVYYPAPQHYAPREKPYAGSGKYRRNRARQVQHSSRCTTYLVLSIVFVIMGGMCGLPIMGNVVVFMLAVMEFQRMSYNKINTHKAQVISAIIISGVSVAAAGLYMISVILD